LNEWMLVMHEFEAHFHICFKGVEMSTLPDGRSATNVGKV